MRRWFFASMLLLLAAPAQAWEPAAAHVRLGEVLRVVGEEYEAREQVRPLLLLEGALRVASEAIPALLHERRGQTGSERLHVRVGAREAQYDLAAVTTLARLEALLEQIAAHIGASLPPSEQPPQLSALFATGMLRAMDSHSALLSAAAYGDFQSKASGRIGGLGMLLARHERHLTVDSVLPGSPATRAGVLPGDRILQIGDQAALYLPVGEALGLVRGRVGTLVSLLILRPRETIPRQLLLRRSDLHFASVESRLIREGPREQVAYVRVRSFQETTALELREHLHRLRVGNAGLQGIVLDLRDNPGGVLEQAVRVVDLFLDRGTIVTMRGPRLQEEAVPARWDRSMSSAPLIVLINGGTASAAEIVAGALQFNHRALLVGTPTFGKDSIQSVFPLSGGNALKLTVARFYPMGERSIEATGIVPHVVLRPVQAGPDAPRVRGLLDTALGPSRPDGRLPATAGVVPPRELAYLAGRAHPRDDAAGTDDYPFSLALRLLQLNAPQGQGLLLSNARDWLQRERRLQDQRIAERIAATGVDWSPGSGGPGGQVELARVLLETRDEAARRWSPLAEGAPVAAGARIRLTLTLRNAGALPLYRVLAISQSEAAHLDGLELPVGVLPAGGTAQASIELVAPADQPEGSEPLRLRIYDGRRQLHYLATVFMPQAPAPDGRLQLAIAAFDDGTGGSRGNGDGRAQPGEVVALRVRLVNASRTPTGSGRYWLSGAATGGQTSNLQAWRIFGSVAPARSVEDYVLVAFQPNADAEERSLTLNLMSDRYASPEVSWPFRLGVGRPLPRLTLEAPRLELPSPERHADGERALLHGWVRDDRALSDVVVYLNGRKVHYQAPDPSAPTAMDLRAELALEPGRNTLRVVARDRDGLVGTRSFVLWRGRGAGFPIAGLSPGGA